MPTHKSSASIPYVTGKERPLILQLIAMFKWTISSSSMRKVFQV